MKSQGFYKEHKVYTTGPGNSRLVSKKGPDSGPFNGSQVSCVLSSFK